MRFPIAPMVALVLLTTCAPTADLPGTAVTGSTVASVTAAPGGGDAGAVPADPAQAPGQPAAPPADAEPPAPEPLVLPEANPPVAPDDNRALAEIITIAEQAVRDPARRPEELEPAGHWLQVIYQRLSAEPGRLDAVLADVPADLHAAVRRNVFAGSRLVEMSARLDPTKPPRPLPNWHIVAPPPADELKAYYDEAAAATGVHWSYLAAINLVETRMGRIHGVSTAGAQGPMQFMPATWAEWGAGDIHDHRDAIAAAARYLRGSGMPGDVNGAIFRYNRDIRYVDAVRTYAEQMQADPRAYYGYYHWQVYYNTRADNVWLAPGYGG